MHSGKHCLVFILHITPGYALLFTKLLCNGCLACRLTISKKN